MAIKPKLKACVLALMLALPLSAGAVGLGRLNVLSGLGQPFRAEIDLVSVPAGESEGLLARLASPEAFAQAQVAYPPASLGLRFVVNKRANGQHVVLISSSQSISEPFLDLLVDLSWSGGRIQRDYTALIDPPGYASSAAAANNAAKQGESFAPAVLPGTRRKGAVLNSKKVDEASAASSAQAEKKADSNQYKVKAGDTLSSVARQSDAEGVTLEQMLVGLYRQNPDAFDGNMNRLRRGKILNIPSKNDLQSLPAREAGAEVRLQAKDWQAYRSKVAEAVQKQPAVAGNEPANAGRITPKVEEKVKPGNANQDVLKLSKGEAPGKAKPGQQGEQARIRALEEEVAARQKGLDESNQRVAALQKNLHDMEKLLALKSRVGAEMQKASKPGEAPVPTAVATPVPADVPAPAELPVASAVVDTPIASAAIGEVDASAVVAETPKVRRRIAIPAPVPEPESDVMDVVFDNALPIGGGLAALLLGGVGLWWARRRKNGNTFADSILTGGDLKSNTLLGNTGGAVISTQPTENSFLTDFSRQGLGTIDTDEVDPIAEAEVYMAYDRNEQAEEILRDALLKDPARHEIRMKLLEIFAAKKDPTSYEEIAADLYTMTSGKGAQWEQAAYQGNVLDPDNPLYKRVEPVAVAGAASAVAVAAVAATSMNLAKGADKPLDDFDLPLDELPVVAAGKVSDFDSLMSENIAEVPSQQDSLTDLDLSLDFDMGNTVAMTPADEPMLDIDPTAADLDDLLPEVPAESLPATESFDMGIDFGLDDFLVPEDAKKPEAALDLSQDDGETMLALDMPVDFSASNVSKAEAPKDPFDLDFDGLEGLDTLPVVEPLPKLSPVLPDLDLGELPAINDVIEAPAALDDIFDAPALGAEEVLEASSADDGLGLDFDFSLDTPLEITAPNVLVEESIDLAEMNLDFAADAGTSADPTLNFSGDDPVQTKIDLAKAYVDMGDTEGAREILQEAMGEGNPEQQKQAQALLGNL
ncbi:FimV/HubP family polar landmark protein [Iodobacter arcticus]|uniref:FimV/HubP family polar landmark protein n=1 Tax=Iodobacter arcticus TaxID=590593 RepID=A0ABW2R227_9NEIS